MPLIDIDKHKALAIADILKYYHSQDDTDLDNVMQMARELGEVLDKACVAEPGLKEAIEQELGGGWEDVIGEDDGPSCLHHGDDLLSEGCEYCSFILSGRKFIASFEPQIWLRDYAVSVDPEGPTSWDCTEYLLKLYDEYVIHMRDAGYVPTALEAVPDARDMFNHGDGLKNDPKAPRWIRDWGGPYEIATDIEPDDVDVEVSD